MHPALYSHEMAHIGASYTANPYLGTYSEFDYYAPNDYDYAFGDYDYYAGAVPNPLGMAYDMGQGIGQGLRRSAPSANLSANRNPSTSNYSDDHGDHNSTDWSGVAKVALVVGGAAAIYFIYRASKAAAPVAERLGGVAGKLALARAGRGSGSFARPSTMGAEVVSSRKLLTA
jgi:hypothetical protein